MWIPWGFDSWPDSHSVTLRWVPNSVFLTFLQMMLMLLVLRSQFSSVQSLSRVWLFATPWIAAPQASLSVTSSRSSLKLTSIESVMPSSHLILCHPFLLLPPIPPSIRVFSNESTLRMRWVFINNMGFPHSSVGKESACNAGYLGLILGLGRSHREGKGYPLQYSGLGDSMDCIDSVRFFCQCCCCCC